GMSRPREAINAAMLAPAERVDRAIEADVWRAVAGQDRLRALDRHRRPPFGDSVERLDLVEPFVLGHALLEIEARRRGIAGRSAPMVGLDGHRQTLYQS